MFRTQRTDGDHVLVEHHEGQPAIALQRVLLLEVEDRLALAGLQPEVSRDLAVMLVGLAIALLPTVELRWREPQLGEERPDGQLGDLGSAADEIDNLVAQVMGNPAVLQCSPSSFFTLTNSSDISAMTLSLRRSLCSRVSILSSSRRSRRATPRCGSKALAA